MYSWAAVSGLYFYFLIPLEINTEAQSSNERIKENKHN